ncbi:MAG: prepilin-type N-terminal cleavage/methylation domain-containing protein [Verrucomicrobiota bacterium]
MMISAIGNDAGVDRRRNLRPAKTAKAFTLIEVLLAVVILGLGVVGIMRSYAVAARALSISGAKLESLCLVKEAFARLEQPSLSDTGLPPGNYIQAVTGAFVPGSQWILKINIADDDVCRKVTIEAGQEKKSLSGGFRLYGYVAP